MCIGKNMKGWICYLIISISLFIITVTVHTIDIKITYITWVTQTTFLYVYEENIINYTFVFEMSFAVKWFMTDFHR